MADNAHEKNKGGRPTKYKPEYADQAKRLCSVMGATDKQLADYFEVDEATVNRWKKSQPEFCESLKAKDDADEQVKQALFKRAIGCSVPDSDIRVIEGKIVITPLEKHFPPDTTAALAWLHNRRPEEWKPRKAISDDDNGSMKEPARIIFNAEPRKDHG